MIAQNMPTWLPFAIVLCCLMALLTYKLRWSAVLIVMLRN